MEGDMVAKVKKETVLACMNCPLCDKLLRDATTISECLHTCQFFLTLFDLRFNSLLFGDYFLCKFAISRLYRCLIEYLCVV